MTVPPDARDHPSGEPLKAGQAMQDQAASVEPSLAAQTSDTSIDPATGSTAPTVGAPSTSVAGEHSAEEESSQPGGAKRKLAALAAGATTLAKKIRKAGPKKVRDVRVRRTADQCVILTEVAGRPVAVGPYRHAHAAQKDATRIEAAQVVELKSPAVHFTTPADKETTALTS